MSTWKEFIDIQNKKPTTVAIFKKLASIGKDEYYPNMDVIYRCFRETPLAEVNQVIVGQDPYFHGPADGLAFSTTNEITPASLAVLYRYLAKHELILEPQKSNDLTPWAHQGILMLNAALTVEKNKPKSMLEDWEQFTMSVLRKVADTNPKAQFYTFGTHAQKLAHTCLKDKLKQVHCYVHPAWFTYKNMDVPDNIESNPFYAMSIHAKKQFNTEIEWKL